MSKSMGVVELRTEYAEGIRDFRGVEVIGDVAGRKPLVALDFSDANFALAFLDGADCRGTSFLNASFKGASLKNVDFGDVNFSSANLSGADMKYANLKGAVVTSAQLASTRDLEHAFMDPGRFADAVAAGYKIVTPM